MKKEEFILRAKRIAEYSEKEFALEEILDIGFENLLSKMVNEAGELLIMSVNPNLSGVNEDYFHETFWNNLIYSDDDEWEKFYEDLSRGVADPEYIRLYG